RPPGRPPQRALSQVTQPADPKMHRAALAASGGAVVCSRECDVFHPCLMLVPVRAEVWCAGGSERGQARGTACAYLVELRDAGRRHCPLLFWAEHLLRLHGAATLRPPPHAKQRGGGADSSHPRAGDLWAATARGLACRAAPACNALYPGGDHPGAGAVSLPGGRYALAGAGSSRPAVDPLPAVYLPRGGQWRPYLPCLARSDRAGHSASMVRALPRLLERPRRTTWHRWRGYCRMAACACGMARELCA